MRCTIATSTIHSLNLYNNYQHQSQSSLVAAIRFPSPMHPPIIHFPQVVHPHSPSLMTLHPQKPSSKLGLVYRTRYAYRKLCGFELAHAMAALNYVRQLRNYQTTWLVDNVAALKDAKARRGNKGEKKRRKKRRILDSRCDLLHRCILVGCQDKGLRGKGREEDMRGGNARVLAFQGKMFEGFTEMMDVL